MSECVDCGTHIRTGARCDMHRVEHANANHEFLTDGKGELDLSPEKQADRLLGKAINHSSSKRGDEALDCREQAYDAYGDIPYTAWRFMQASKTCDPTGSEFRRYLELARHEIQVVR